MKAKLMTEYGMNSNIALMVGAYILIWQLSLLKDLRLHLKYFMCSEVVNQPIEEVLIRYVNNGKYWNRIIKTFSGPLDK